MRQEIMFDPELRSARTLVWWLYLFHSASFLFSLGALSWLPLIVNYIKRGETAGTFVYTHHSWQIRSFWWYVFWLVIGGILFLTVVGIPLAWLVWGAAWLWKAYRLVRGMLDLSANKPMPI